MDTKKEVVMAQEYPFPPVLARAASGAASNSDAPCAALPV